MGTAAKIEISEEAKSLTATGGEKAKGLLELIQESDITSSEDYEVAGTMLKDLKGQAKKLKDSRTEITGPMNQALEATRKLFRGPLKVLDECEAMIKKKMADYKNAIEEERQKALEVAGAASMAGDEKVAVAAMQRAAASKAPEVAGVSMTEVWDYEIVDEGKVPREFMCVDDSVVMATIKKNKGSTKIPGLRIFSKTSVRSASS